MAQQNRDDIKANFRTGDRPTEEQFGDVFDSYLNITEDQVNVDENLNLGVGGSITLSNNGNSRNEPGTLRWNGTAFEAFDPTTSTFVPLGSGTDVNWTELTDNNIQFNEGNVAIGPIDSPTDRLEVFLNNAMQRVRFGLTALGNGPGSLGGHAIFSHTEVRDSSNYAIVQDSDGAVRVNASREGLLTLRGGGEVCCTVERTDNGGYLYVNSNRAVNETNDNFFLQVEGSAFKSDGEGEWNVTSDIRVKKSIKQFEDGLQKLRKIKPIQFQYNGEGNTINNLKAIGISAQELAQVFPYMVQGLNENRGTPENEDAYLTTNTSSLKYVMLNAINELAEKVENIENSLEKIIKKLGGLE